MAKFKPLEVGQIVKMDGCFTEEYFLRGLSVKQIGQELGLPAHRMIKGVFVIFALELPQYHQFELGGWAEFATDKFIDYDNDGMNWDEKKFEDLYANRRMPISIDDAKTNWMKNMMNEKLVKVITAVGSSKDDIYPSGGKASQIILREKVNCQVVQFLKSNDIFHSVWG